MTCVHSIFVMVFMALSKNRKPEVGNLLLTGERAERANSKATFVTRKTPCLDAAGKRWGTGNGNWFVARRCEASGEAVAEPLCKPSELNSKATRRVMR